MGSFRHPFETAPYTGAVCPIPAAIGGATEIRLDDQDRVFIRGLRPELGARWAATAGSALFSMLLYSALWDGAVASGLVLGMWLHELGHSFVLRRLGLPSGPIVFVPFIGATQRAPERPSRASDAALLALMGPAFALGFAACCKLGYAATGDPALRLLATAHAILAMIDLVPLGALDGGRVVETLSRRDRVACAVGTGVLAIACRSSVLAPVCLAFAWTATRPAPLRSEPRIAVAVLAALGFALLMQR